MKSPLNSPPPSIPGVCYESVCSGKPNGRYVDTTHSCRRWFECEEGQFKSVTTCPLGQLFNGFSCVTESSVHCGLPENNAIAYPKVATLAAPRDLCSGLKDGFHSDPGAVNCQGYLNCADGRLVEKLSCGDQGAFDEVMKKCIPSQLYNCPHPIQTASSVTSFSRTQLIQEDAATKKIDLCMWKANGFHVDARLGCRFYIKCTSGKTLGHFECRPGQYFDVRNKSCQSDQQQNRFYDESRQNCVNPAPSKDCDRQENGFYTTPRSECKSYFYCHNGKKTILRCPEGEVFDGRDCVTAGASAFECPITDESCSAKPDGYYKDYFSGSCRSYYYCANGKRLTYLCAENQFFDGEKCVLRMNDQFACNSLVKSECADRPDGYYQNFAAGCRKYHYCLRGEKVTMLTCRDNKVFNGLSCVSPSAYNCASDTQECVRRSCPRKECDTDGFFADYEAGCRVYYFCIAGNKTVLNCSDGYVFNGESCVSELQYKCPVCQSCSSSVRRLD